jgi:signal transduction histidine kinase
MKHSNKLLNFIFIIALIFLYILSFGNYLLFHSYAEIFSIIIAAILFIIAWNSRDIIDNKYILFIGISYLFIANLDFLHLLGYKGMNIFTDYDYYANQIWIATRALEALSLAIGFVFISQNINLNPRFVLIVYVIIFILIAISIFQLKIFPECFIDGKGQTDFKIFSEYVISFTLLIALLLLIKFKNEFNNKVYRYLFWSIIFTIIAEISFTFYVSNYGISNMIGHYMKIISFYLIYLSVVDTAIRDPYNIIFKKLNDRRIKLDIANKTKDKFFSIISHDLRSPFNSLLGFSKLLINNYDNFDEGEKKEMIQLMHHTSKNTLNLLENLLEWARIQTNRIEYSPVTFNISNTTIEIINLLNAYAKKKEIDISIKVQNDIIVFADEKMLSSVIRNLISNAIKYTYKNGKIIISLEKSGELIKLSIEDNGIGMDKKTLDSLFLIDKTNSVPGTDDEQGTGLGLILVKDFIEKNNGKIKVESKPGKGSKFIISLRIHD